MKRDRRLAAAGITLASIVVLGLLVTWLPNPQPQTVAAPAAPDSAAATHARQARAAEIKDRFEQAVVMLHAKQYDFAVKALHRVLELAPRLPEAHVNMGYALLGQGEARAAADFFNTAIELKPQQVNAYYGLAEALELQGDLEGAMGAMRSFIHLSQADDPYLPKARAALWVWETELNKRREQAADARGGPAG